MDEDPAVKAYSIPKEAWLGYYQDSKDGTVDRYDRLLATN